MIRCKPNGKVYVGQSTNIKRRFNEHKSKLRRNIHNNELLQNDWNIYGEDNFEFEILQECIKEQLDELEIENIDKFNSFENGYNETIGGNKGTTMSEESCRKMSTIRKGKRCGEENSFYGKRHSEVSKKKMSESHKGRKLSEETKKKLTESSRGQVHSKESIKKQIENNPRTLKLICIFPDGTQTEIMYQKELAEYLGINKSIIRKLTNDKVEYNPRNKRHKHLKGIKIIKVEESDINGK